jgi:dTDP-D-glucose 4,6-dehydratase
MAAAETPDTPMDDYQPNNILVTGGAGFIASAFVLRMIEKYPAYKIVVLDKLDYCASRKHLEHLERLRNFKFIKGDIQEADLLNYLLESEQIDTILHFAAQTHVDNSFGNSVIFTTNNVVGPPPAPCSL